MELTSLFIAVAGGEDRGVTCQQFDRQRFDPSYQRHCHPWAFDRHHPRNRRHPATVLKQPEEREKRAVGREDRKDRWKERKKRRGSKRRKTRGKVGTGEEWSDKDEWAFGKIREAGSVERTGKEKREGGEGRSWE